MDWGRRLCIAAASAALALPAPAWADDVRVIDPGDPVPGHPDMTYLDLIGLAVPGLALNPADGQIEARLEPPRHIAGHDMEGPPPDPAVLGFLDERRILVGGRKRIVLLADLGADPDRAQDTALLVLFDDEAAKPRVLDLADVALDKDTDFAEGQSLLPLGAGDSALVLYSEHNDSDLSLGHYMIVSPLGDRLTTVAMFDVTSERLCSWSGDERAHFGTARDPDRHYRRIEVWVRAVFTHTGETGCTDERLPRAQTRLFHAAYRWSDASRRFEPEGDDLDALDALNDQAFGP